MAHLPEPITFAADLRQRRLAAGLTQEALAERAGMSVRGIQNLEGGVSSPYRESVRRLAAALRLTDEGTAAFLATAQPAPRRARSKVDGQDCVACHNLPAQVSSFVGRERELAEVGRLLDRARLVTLVGPPGVGKTRLAVHVARSTAGRFPNGVCFVPLAEVGTAADVPAAIARALRVEPEGDVGDAPCAALRDRRLLLLLDNCEHVLAAAPLVAQLLAPAPSLTVLATSRAPIALSAEQEFPVPPLALPDPAAALSPEVLAQIEAVRLFLDRSRAIRPDFVLTETNAEAVVAICRRLDALPLAIELAAARTRLFLPNELLVRLQSRLPFLAGGPRDLPARQRTLRAAIAWSYDLLAPDRQMLFRRLAVFPGGCDVEAAGTVVPVDARKGLDLLCALEELAAHSLIRPEARDDGAVVFRMLETIREFGLERLAATGEDGTTGDAFLHHYTALAEAARAGSAGPERRRWLVRIEADYANFGEALRLAVETCDAARALHLANAPAAYWLDRGGRAEGRQWLERVVALTDGPPAERATALASRARLAFLSDDPRAVCYAEEAEAVARAAGNSAATTTALLMRGAAARKRGLASDEEVAGWFAEALAIARTNGDRRGMAFALGWQARLILEQQRDPVLAETLLAESIAICRALGDDAALIQPLVLAGTAARRRGDTDGAQRRHEEALALARRNGSRQGQVYASVVYAIEAHDAGDYAVARRWFARCIELGREMGQVDSASVYRMLAAAEAAEGAYPAVHDHFLESLKQWRQIGHEAGMRWCLDGLAALAAELGQPRDALRLAGAADTAGCHPGWSATQRERAVLEAARQALGEEAAAAAWTEGRALALEEAVTETLKGVFSALATPRCWHRKPPAEPAKDRRHGAP